MTATNVSPITAFLALTDIAEAEQCEELEGYLTSKGAKFKVDPDIQLSDRFLSILEQSQFVFQDKDLSQQEVEGFFYNVVSLFHVVAPDDARNYMTVFLDRLVSSANRDNASCILRLLGMTFSHFDPTHHLCPLILERRLEVARKTGMELSLPLDLEKLKKWFSGWNLSDQAKKDLYLQLWNTYKESSNKSLRTGLLIQLLECYSPSEAHQVADLARQLVVLSIAEPHLFLLDHLLSIEPVTALRGEKIFQLVSIFVKEKLSSFQEFYTSNKEFVDNLGLDYSECLHKMRLLTLSSLAVEAKEVSFSDLTTELCLSQEEVEQIIIEAIQLKLIRARINQVSQSLVVMSSVHRTFEKPHWLLLKEQLTSIKHSIHRVKSSLNNLKT